jgi:RNA polymerase sigma-70 factor, ECF subfamily
MPDVPSPLTVEQWFALAYEELRRLAYAVRQREGRITLSPTALVHEAYLRLASHHGAMPESRAHFMATAARAMRRVLVDLARRAQAAKRGQSPELVTLDGSEPSPLDLSIEQVLALDDAIEELARRDARAALVVQLRFFAGLSGREIAEAVALSEATVEREWRFARAWLAERLQTAD